MLVGCSSSSSSSSSMQRHLWHIRPTNIHQLGVCVILSLSACAKTHCHLNSSNLSQHASSSSHMHHHHHPPPPFSTHCSLSMFKPFIWLHLRFCSCFFCFLISMLYFILIYISSVLLLFSFF